MCEHSMCVHMYSMCEPLCQVLHMTPMHAHKTATDFSYSASTELYVCVLYNNVVIIIIHVDVQL